MRRSAIFLPLIFCSCHALAIEDGEKCSTVTRLPKNFTCFQEEVYDCRKPQGREGYVACGGLKESKLRAELKSRYSRLLMLYGKEPKQGQNFESAKEELVKSQQAWEKFVKADCSLASSLIGTGNAHAGIPSDCENSHLARRIERFKQLEKDTN